MRAENRKSAVPQALASIWHNIGGGAKIWTHSARHSGARQRVRAERGPMTGSARTSGAQLRTGESRDSGSGPRSGPSRNDKVQKQKEARFRGPVSLGVNRSSTVMAMPVAVVTMAAIAKLHRFQFKVGHA